MNEPVQSDAAPEAVGSHGTSCEKGKLFRVQNPSSLGRDPHDAATGREIRGRLSQATQGLESSPGSADRKMAASVGRLMNLRAHLAYNLWASKIYPYSYTKSVGTQTYRVEEGRVIDYHPVIPCVGEYCSTCKAQPSK